MKRFACLLILALSAMPLAATTAAEPSTATQVATATENLKQAAATTEDIVNTILKKSIDAATQGAEFLKEQVPDVVQQLLRWTFWDALIKGVILLTVFFIPFFFWVRILRTCIKDKWENEDRNFLAVGLAVVIFVVGGICFGEGIGYLLVALKTVVAPKVWLLEYGAHLIRH